MVGSHREGELNGSERRASIPGSVILCAVTLLSLLEPAFGKGKFSVGDCPTLASLGSREQGSFSIMLQDSGGLLILRGGGGKKVEEKKTVKRNTPTEHRLFIANLPQGLNEDGLREAFEVFGELEECKVMRDIETGQSRRMAYVSYKTAMEAEEALEEMDKAKICAPMSNGGPAICTKIQVHEAKAPQKTW